MSKMAAFAAGCFWGVEEAFLSSGFKLNTIVGYCGGNVPSPSYEKVCAGETGHAETVRIEYDPAKVSYNDLLAVFWNCHDPTTKNRQGPDVGTQYRSVIFYYDEEQLDSAKKSLKEQSARRPKQIVTEILPAQPFFPAENYHQKYHRKHSGSCRT